KTANLKLSFLSGLSLGGFKPPSTGGLTLSGTPSSTPLLSSLVAGTATTSAPVALAGNTQTTQPTGGLQLSKPTQPLGGIQLGTVTQPTVGLGIGNSTTSSSGFSLGNVTSTPARATSVSSTATSGFTIPAAVGLSTTTSGTSGFAVPGATAGRSTTTSGTSGFTLSGVNTTFGAIGASKSTTSSTTATSTTATASSTGATCTVPQLTYKQLEEQINKRYGLAKDIDGQLKQMVGDLKAIIDHLNAAGTTQQENNDPIVQVAKILNAHMNSLQWIDQNAALLQRKVDEVSSMSEIRRKEQERNFRLAFD
ncbi:nuclear pore glycoprotein p62, partial [Exaiptasia diaphana]|uniref:Nucleoporin NSP1-like C-terminal domain-containing protein n=1 Tax=Exaiptasia diaphana TaxID=2652724 RepID=A0A913YHE5_EXADI